jgi:glycogen(starch) synthase
MPKNLRILHLTSEFPPFIWGGLGRAVGGVVSGLQASGVRVAVAFVSDEADLKNIRFYGRTAGLAEDTPEFSSDAFLLINSSHETEATISRLQAWGPHLLHVHTTWLLDVAQVFKRALNIPLVYTVHAYHRAEYEIGQNVSYDWMQDSYREQGLLIAAADSIIVLTRREFELMRRYYPWAIPRTAIIGNGVEDCELPRAPSVQQGKVRALYVGRMDARKGIDELMSAIPIICRAYDQIDFIFAGGWRTMTGEQVRDSWLKGSATLYADRISFLGWLNSSQLCEQYRAADILVVPSRYEPFGLVLLEGMIHGMAVAASASEGAQEIIRHGGTGLVFPRQDVDALAETVLLLAQNPELRATVSGNGQRAARREWLWSEAVEKIIDLYAEVIRHWKR